MKAALCREFKAPLTIEDVRVAAPGPGEVAVDIKACAVCHSDITFIEGGWGGPLPTVFGHEAAGVVTEVGGGVRHVAPGDHVVVTLVRSCGTCPCCEQGFYGSCETRYPLDKQSPLSLPGGETVGHGLRTGAFAEKAVVEASQLVAIDKDVPLASASLLACGVITGFGAVTNTAQMRPGASVVVVGAGGVGLNAIQGAAIRGARQVIAVDLSDDKLAAARQFGATDVINAGTADVMAEIKRIAGRRRADYCFVTVGAKIAFDQACDMVGRGGTVVIVGMAPAGVLSEYDPLGLADASKRILGSKMGSSNIQRDIPALVSLYKQGRLKLDELVTGRFPLEGVNEAIAGVLDGSALRNVIVMDDAS